MLGSYQAIKALGRWLTFPPQLARAIGIEEAVFLVNLMFLASDEEEWVERTSAQLEKETTLTYKQQTRVRDRLISLGLLEVRTNRVKHETFYRVVEEKFDALVAILRRKREFDELTFGSNSTLPKVNSTNLPKGSSNTLKELEEKNKREEEAPLPLCKEERRALPKPVKEPKVRKGFQKTILAPRILAKKPPVDWNWFAIIWQHRAECLPIGSLAAWEELEARLKYFSKEQIEERMSRWLDQPGRRITGWSALDFLRDCALMDEKEAGDIPAIANEE